MQDIIKALMGKEFSSLVEYTMVYIDRDRRKYEVDTDTWLRWMALYTSHEYQKLLDLILEHKAIVILKENPYFKEILTKYIQKIAEAHKEAKQIANAIKQDPSLTFIQADKIKAATYRQKQGPLLRKHIDNITLIDKGQEYDLGPFDITLALESYEVRATPVEPVFSYKHKQFFHPHVSEIHTICFGDAQAAFFNALDNKDILSIFDIAEAVLTSYNASGAYTRLSSWYPPRCRTCGEEQAHECASCGTPRCNDHSTRCECGREHCESCQPQCTVCGDDTCECQMKTCSNSGDFLCDECAIICEDCKVALSPEKADKCKCGAALCSFCGTTCDECDEIFCDKCAEELVVTGGNGDEQTHICPDCLEKQQAEKQDA